MESVFWEYVHGNIHLLRDRSQSRREKFRRTSGRLLQEELLSNGMWQEWWITDSRSGVAELLIELWYGVHNGRKYVEGPLGKIRILPSNIALETREREFADMCRCTPPSQCTTFVWYTRDGGDYTVMCFPKASTERISQIIRREVMTWQDIDGAAICFLEPGDRLRIYPFPETWRSLVS